MNNVVFLSLSMEELKDAIRDVVKQELNHKKAKELMTFKETCELLNISASCLNQWKASNKIPYKKLGKRVFFLRSEVVEALKESNYSKIKELQ